MVDANPDWPPKPCPFCGHEVLLHQPPAAYELEISYILCDGCGLVASFRPNLQHMDTVRAFNRRVP